MNESQNGSDVSGNNKKRSSLIWWVLGLGLVFVAPLLIGSSKRSECTNKIDFHPAGTDLFGQGNNEDYYSYGNGPGTRKQFPTKSDAIDYCVSLE